ncbi:NAD(P)/FAD-dependent oxidoreductase [Acholeplasma granularum]|uniref:NAD(P)/FAD-dependent oxidoreductase n=1 Tax=Acholeplasma granularum TaxID=264635 RepID=UPI0004716A7F|nr:NAD(P)/FAD-dependent oxidoreductase [Acholeplasma granularum]
MINCIVIGVGPAGISAALNLRKLNRTVMVLGKDSDQLSNLDVIDNLYGQLPISGKKLIVKGIEQARHLGIEVKKEMVLNVEKIDDHFLVTTNNNKYLSQTVMLATGKPRVEINIPGYDLFKSKGIHLCATCDGLFYKNKPVAIIGDGLYMEQELSVLENYTRDIRIFSNSTLITSKKYPVITDKIISFEGDKRLTKINTENNSYDVRGVFLAINYPRAVELSLKLGVIMDDSNILVDSDMSTNINGLFAGGDCVGGPLYFPKAINDGLNAALGISKYLKNKA